jgi:hypothetical protein
VEEKGAFSAGVPVLLNIGVDSLASKGVLRFFFRLFFCPEPVLANHPF